MTALHWRDLILDRIEARCRIEDTGFVLDDKPSPCHRIKRANEAI